MISPRPRGPYPSRGAAPRRRFLAGPVEPLESRAVPAAGLATFRGGAFAAAVDVVPEGRRNDLVRIEPDGGTIETGRSRMAWISVSAFDDQGNPLRLNLRGAGGGPLAQSRQDDGS